MKTDIKGVSQCPKGVESYEYFYSDILKKELIQYDYRYDNGELFSCIAKNLEQARIKRNKNQRSKKNGKHNNN